MGRYIYCLENKVTIIAEIIGEKRGVSSFTRPQLAQLCQVKYSTLRSAWHRNIVTPDIEDALGTVAEFDKNHIAWYDPEFDGNDEPSFGRRKDDPHSFRQYLRQLHKLKGADTRRVRSLAPQLWNPRALVFTLDGGRQAIPADKSAPLFLSLHVQPMHVAEGLIFGFRSVLLHLSIEKDSAASFTQRIGTSGPAKLGKAKVKGQGIDQAPAWKIEAADAKGVLDGEYETTDAPLCELENADLGEKITADIAISPYDGSIAATDGGQLPSEAKQKVLKLLMTAKIDKRDDGWVVLGRQKISLGRTDD